MISSNNDSLRLIHMSHYRIIEMNTWYLRYVVDVGIARDKVSKSNGEQADEAEIRSVHVIPSLKIAYPFLNNSTIHLKGDNVFCFLSSLPLLTPGHHSSVWAPICHLSTLS